MSYNYDVGYVEGSLKSDLDPVSHFGTTPACDEWTDKQKAIANAANKNRPQYGEVTQIFLLIEVEVEYRTFV